MADFPILETERDKRTWAWIVAQVGEPAARAVDLKGRKPFVSNFAKALGLQVPVDLALASRETAAAHLAKMSRILGSPQKTEKIAR